MPTIVSFGSDPEWVVKSKDGKIKSAIGIINGTKEKRIAVDGGHEFYYDNVLAECSIRPGNSAEESVESFRDCFQKYASLVQPCVLAIQASMDFPKEELQHKDAEAFGCSVEMDSYEVAIIDPPTCAGNFRSAGGHVHIGYDGGKDIENDEELNYKVAWDRIWVIRMCDIFLGIPSLILDKDPSSRSRRKLYGKAGSHRSCKHYGCEYRVLGNFWLAKPSLVSLIYDLSSVCVDLVMEKQIHEEIWESIDPDHLKKTINNWDTKGIKKYDNIIKKYTPDNLMQSLKKEMDSDDVRDKFYDNWGIK